ncbi:unnamed protein product [Paramecium sonneborni]|uniref:Uncharacterized protein n=1 Tax=Paramecium sonneborni TaxID=65129 RepID=A0A8S1PKY8_9CILI|nr:unnamed protein product [Paramecium sonneborni]
MSDYQIKYQEIKGSLAILMQQNNALKQQLKEACEELQEKQLLKEEWAEEVQRVSETIHLLQSENANLLQENEHLNRNCLESKYLIEQQIEQITILKDQNDKLVVQLDQCRQQNLQKELIIKQQRDDNIKQIEQLQQQYNEEIKKLQGIIDNQNGLIQSYEKLNEIDKQDQQHYKQQNQIQFEDQFIELKNRNLILQNKINDEKQKYDQLYEQHRDEVQKLQSVIKEQKDLLNQYERIIERDKKQAQQQTQLNNTPVNMQYEIAQVPQLQQMKQVHQQIPQQPLYSQPNLNQNVYQQTLASPLLYDKCNQPSPTYLHTQPNYAQPNYAQPISQRPPKTFFTNNKINHQLNQITRDKQNSREYNQKRSFHFDDEEDSKRVEKEFQEEFLNKFQNVIGRMEDKLYQMQSELNISGISEKPKKLR